MAYRITHGIMTRSNAMEQSETPDTLDMVTDHIERFESLENGYIKQEQSTASPRSYLSMPSCKQFPSMRSVEPLSRVLEPAMVIYLQTLDYTIQLLLYIYIIIIKSRRDTWISARLN